MSLTKQLYDSKKLYDISDVEYYEKILYIEGIVKPNSSLINGGELALTWGKKNRRKHVVVER
jgi:hypothetical protein